MHWLSFGESGTYIYIYTICIFTDKIRNSENLHLFLLLVVKKKDRFCGIARKKLLPRQSLYSNCKLKGSASDSIDS